MKNKVKIIEDKKAFIVSIIIFIVLIISIKNYYWFYPPPPIDSITSKEAIERLEESENGFVKIATEENYDWYLSVDFNMMEYYIYHPLMLKGWAYTGMSDTTTGYERFHSKDGVTLKLEVYSWVKGYQFLKIYSGVDF